MKSPSVGNADNHFRLKELDAKQIRLLDQVRQDGSSCIGVFEKAYRGRSRSAAIKATCLQCMWLDREAIRECTDTSCPSHSYRPFQEVRR